MLRCDEAPSNRQYNVEENISWEFTSAVSGNTMIVSSGGSRVVLGTRTLTITRLGLEDSGTYMCVASHSLVTSIRTEVLLTVEGGERGGGGGGGGGG